MRYFRFLAGFALAVGMAVPGASILSAQDFDRWRDARRDSQEIRQDYQHIGNDYANLDAMRFHIAQDRACLNEGRDIQHDRANLYDEHRDFNRDYRNQWFSR